MALPISNYNKRLVSFLGINLVFTGIKFIIGFFFSPILSQYLSTNDVGKIGLFLAIQTLATTFVTANLQTFLWKKKYDISVENFTNYINIAICIIFFLSMGMLIIALILHNYLFENFNFWYCLMPFLAFFEALIIIGSTQAFSESKFIRGNVLTIGKLSVDFGITIMIVVLLEKHNFFARIIGYGMGCLLFGGVVLIDYLPNFKLNFTKENVKSTIRFIAPLFPTLLFDLIILNGDRYIIEYFLGDAQVGIYTIAYTIGIALLAIDSSLSSVWTNRFYILIEDFATNKYVIYKYLAFYMGSIIICGCAIGFATPYIYQFLINPNFHSGKVVVPYIILGYVFNAANKNVLLFLWKQGRTKAIAFNSFITAIFSVALNIYFIPKMGITGAGIVTSLTYLILTTLNFFNIKLVKPKLNFEK